MIKEGTRTGLSPRSDEISEVLGSPGHFRRYYFKGLRELCLGEHSKELVGVSRYYPMEDQREDTAGNILPKRVPVVVDFEPQPTEDKMYLEEKRKFFMEAGIVYIPIFLRDNLTKEQFLDRYEEEKANLIRGYREALEDQSLESEKIPFFTDETIMASIDALALERVTALGLRGAAKIKRLKREKEALLRERMNGLGIDRRQVPASGTAGGPSNR